MAVDLGITPNAVGMTDINYTCVAPNVTKPIALKIRVIATDVANNSNTDEIHSPILTVDFNDTEAPVITPFTNANVVSAETNDANIKSVLFQYRVSGSTSGWIDLGVTNAANATFGNAGSRWVCGVTLANLPAGAYDIRSIATDKFDNVNVNRAPMITALIQVDATGSKTYSLKKSQQISIGITDVQFDNMGGATITLQVKTASALVSAPVASILVTQGANTITKSVTLSGSGTTYSGSITLENFTQTGTANANITVYGETASGSVYGEYTSLAMSAQSQNPLCASNDNLAQVTAWTCPGANALPNMASLLISPKINPDVPTTQTSI